MTLEELAAKYKVDIKFFEDQLKKGIEVEKEHLSDGDDIALAEKIAMDHLHEVPDYYDKLKEVEKKNASQMPEVYYCRHIEKGITGYEDENILIDDDALNSMDRTMAGIPVRVLHVDDIDVNKIQEESDGYVSESFYLKCDGWHWAKFICVSDAAHEAVKKGWSVSNAYMPTEWGPGGESHNLPYNRKITNGRYTHLAIVPNPRYEGAMILTQEQFKEYKATKEKELEELKNQKKGSKIMLKFFKKVPVEQDIDPETAMVQLENGKEVSVKDMIEAVVKNAEEEVKKEKEDEEKVNMDSEIDVGDEKMTVKELVNKYKKSMKKNEDDEEEKKNAEEEEAKKKEEEEKENEEDEKKKKDEEKQNADKLRNAIDNSAGEVVVETSEDQLARGQAKYGK